MFGNLITEALNKGIQMILQHYIAPFGEITSLSIDDSTKEIKATLLLSGELQTLDVHIFGYNFVKIEEKGYLTFVTVATSRDWINSFVPLGKCSSFQITRKSIDKKRITEILCNIGYFEETFLQWCKNCS